MRAGFIAAVCEWVSRLWHTVRRRRTDADLESELQMHLEMAAEDARRRGTSPDAARREARLHAGGVPQAMESLRDRKSVM